MKSRRNADGTVTTATILKFKLWQRDRWEARVVALPEDVCDDYLGTGLTPAQALGSLLVEMARDGKVLIDAHWIDDGWRAWPEGKINHPPLDNSPGSVVE